MVQRNTGTLIVKSVFPAGTSQAGVADIIAKSLTGQTDSTPVCQGGIIRISFLDPQIKKTYEEAGSISFKDITSRVVCTIPFSFVLVYLFPFEGSNDCVREVLKVHPAPKISPPQNESTHRSNQLCEKTPELGRILDFLRPAKVVREVLHDRVLGSLGRARL